MKGHRTDWEDGDEGAQNGLRRRQWMGTGRTEKAAMKGHRTDWEEGNEGAQNGKTTLKGLRTDREGGYEGAQNGQGRRL